MDLCFCHMIKTAGTTFQYILRSSFGAGHVEILNPSIGPDDIHSLLRFNPGLVSMGGHFLRPGSGLETRFPGIRFVILLRDPVDRFISHYNYGRWKKHHDMSIEERLEVRPEANYQTKYISGALLPDDRDFVAEERHLEEAKRALREDFGLVGLVEWFDETLLLLRKTMEDDRLDIRYRRANISPRSYIDKKELSEREIEKIRRSNRMDIRLYEYAREKIFKPLLENYGPSLEADLDSFRENLRGFDFPRSRLLANRLAKHLIYRPLLSMRSRRAKEKRSSGGMNRDGR